MKVSDIIWTPKMQAVLNDCAQFLFLTGATGCSKSLVAGHKFMDWLLNSPTDETQYFMIFKDIGTGVRNFLQETNSFYNMFPDYRDEFKTASAGGIQFIFHGFNGDKIVYILGADDKNSWRKILGSNPDGIWVEEMSELHIDCIREAIGRTVSRKCRLIGTTNGGLPTQEFYTELVNHAVVQFRDTVPAVELAEMVEDKPYMHYYHFSLENDAPHLSAEDKVKLRELYPINSFYYNSKVLGCRGFVEGAAYATLMDKNIHIRNYDDVMFPYLQEIMLALDIGSSKNIDNPNKSATVATLLGFSKDYQRIIILECWLIPAFSHDVIIRECEKHIECYWVKYMSKFKKIVIDSAEAILINTWAEKNKYNTIQVKGAVKSVRGVITLVTRCELKQQLLVQERLIWTDRALNSYNAHTRIKLDEDGSELDMNVQDNDTADSLTYGLTENWNYITKQDRRRLDA